MTVIQYAEVRTKRWKHLKPRERFCQWYLQYSTRSDCLLRSVFTRRLLKGIRTNNGQHWDNEVEPSEEDEFLRWEEQLPIVIETSIDRRYFSRERDKAELLVFADASEDTMCAVAPLRSQPKEYSADLAFVIGKCRVAPMRHLSIRRLELQAAVMAVRLKEQIVKEHGKKMNS